MSMIADPATARLQRGQWGSSAAQPDAGGRRAVANDGTQFGPQRFQRPFYCDPRRRILVAFGNDGIEVLRQLVD